MTCPRCDRAECNATTGRAGPPEVVVVERLCDGEPVDWRARALEAEDERAVGARLLAQATDRQCKLEAESAFRAGELAAQTGVPRDGVQGHWRTRGYAHASRLLRALEAEAEAARLRQALTALLNAVEDSLDVQERPGGEAPWTRQDFAGYLADATTALAGALLAATHGGSDGR